MTKRDKKGFKTYKQKRKRNIARRRSRREINLSSKSFSYYYAYSDYHNSFVNELGNKVKNPSKVDGFTIRRLTLWKKLKIRPINIKKYDNRNRSRNG